MPAYEDMKEFFAHSFMYVLDSLLIKYRTYDVYNILISKFNYTHAFIFIPAEF